MYYFHTFSNTKLVYYPTLSKCTIFEFIAYCALRYLLDLECILKRRDDLYARLKEEKI